MHSNLVKHKTIIAACHFTGVHDVNRNPWGEKSCFSDSESPNTIEFKIFFGKKHKFAHERKIKYQRNKLLL